MFLDIRGLQYKLSPKKICSVDHSMQFNLRDCYSENCAKYTYTVAEEMQSVWMLKRVVHMVTTVH